MNVRLLKILSDTLGLPPENIDAQTSMLATPAWDSIAHLNVCLSVEAEFGLSLSPEEMMAMTSPHAIETLLVERGVA